MDFAISMVERGVVPTPLIRVGIRRLLADRLKEMRGRYPDGPDGEKAHEEWLQHMRESGVALVPEKANEQHYELPPRFFELCLGKRLKYSSGLYADAATTLDEAEEAMLELSCKRAGLADGQDILELGCGWASLTLFMAQRYPNSRITTVSNSAPQRGYIEELLRTHGVSERVTVLTRDVNEFEAGDAAFDRVVSVEMMEHVRNWERLLSRVARWLRPDGRAFVHVFAHARYAYAFEARDSSDWMTEHFFSGGQMPSHDQFDRVLRAAAAAAPAGTPLLREAERFAVPGTHYARTSEDWLRNMDRNKAEVMELFRETYGEGDAAKWFRRWRVFYLSCAELFAYNGGNDWIVSHHVLERAD